MKHIYMVHRMYSVLCRIHTMCVYQIALFEHVQHVCESDIDIRTILFKVLYYFFFSSFVSSRGHSSLYAVIWEWTREESLQQILRSFCQWKWGVPMPITQFWPNYVEMTSEFAYPIWRNRELHWEKNTCGMTGARTKL